ncbi:sulfurtransferase, partial [Xanthomonas citri pv. citri]|nr:sulfurtransferase [Xanthomonas citri pv. citri]
TTGHRAALLDGGLDAFPAEERERHRAVLPAAEFTPVPWPREALATIDEAAHGPVVVDARDRKRFTGHAPDPVDPRSGHIPG